LKHLQKGVEILNAILKQNDAQMMSKLDAVLALLSPLKDEVDLQRKELSVLQQYTEVSQLNILGKSGKVRAPLTEETPISRMLAGAFTMHDVDGAEQVDGVLCDAASMQKFRAVVQSYPKFPLSYYALYVCLNNQGDASWREYANRAEEILKLTTTIDGHHPSQDVYLRDLNQKLKR
jgi:hypothetical protein